MQLFHDSRFPGLWLRCSPRFTRLMERWISGRLPDPGCRRHQENFRAKKNLRRAKLLEGAGNKTRGSQCSALISPAIFFVLETWITATVPEMLIAALLICLPRATNLPASLPAAIIGTKALPAANFSQFYISGQVGFSVSREPDLGFGRPAPELAYFINRGKGDQNPTPWGIIKELSKLQEIWSAAG